MSTFAGVGFSNDLDPVQAARKAAEQARNNLYNSRIDIAFVFCTMHYPPQDVLPVVFEELDQTRLVGCSTGGILLATGMEFHGIGIMAVSSDTVKFENVFTSHIDLQNPLEAGKILVQQAADEFRARQRKALLLFTDNLTIDTEEFLRGLREQAGPLPYIFGAGSSDNFHFDKTYQFHQNKYTTKGASGVFIGSAPYIGISCRHGWRPLGKPRHITEAEKNIVVSIDGEKPLDLYKTYFEAEAVTLMNNPMGQINIRYPIGIKLPGPEQDYLVRFIKDLGKNGELICQNNIAKNSETHIMIGNKETCLRAAETAAFDVKGQLKNKPARLILMIRSLVRQKILGRAAKQEIQVVRDILGKEAPFLGMCSYGEFFTYKDGNKNLRTAVQNGGIILLAIN